MATQTNPIIATDFAGVRNDIPSENMRMAGEGGSDLVQGVNIDINDANRIRDRGGFVKSASGLDMHSLWSNAAGDVTLVVDGTDLKRFNSDNSLTTLGAGLTVNQRMSYTEHAGLIYCSNGLETSVIENGEARSWGLNRPSGPALAADSGLLPAGKYAVAYSYIDTAGRESGLSDAGEIELASDGGIRVVMTGSASARVSRMRVYCTPPEGSVLMHVTDVPNASSAQFIVTQARDSNPAVTQFYDKPLAGSILAAFRGRIYSVRNSLIYYTAPLSTELMSRSGYLGFESRVLMVAPCINGMFVSDELATYWVAGRGPDEFTFNQVAGPAYEHSLAWGSASQMGGLEGDYELPVWLSKNGVTIGLPDGQVVVPNTRFTPQPPANGGAIVRSTSDAYQYLASDGDTQ